MNKLFKKTILISLLAIFLWGGVGFDFEKSRVKDLFLVKSALASKESDAIIDAHKTACGKLTGDAYDDCSNPFIEQLEQQQKIEEKDYIPSSMTGEIIKNMWYFTKHPGEGLALTLDATNDLLKSAAQKAFASILYLILLLANSLVALSGNLFDLSVEYSILKISTYTGILESINTVWATVRDIFNITFIFVLLWLSIKTIIGIAGINTKKMLASVVIAALLINFSLFITRVIIDAGNYVAVAVYNQVLNDVPSINGKKHISSSIMDGLKLSTLYKTTDKTTESPTDSNSVIFMVIKIILAFIVAWVFFMASFLFVGRIVTFFILMSLAPIGFVGDIIPYLKPHAKKWWDTLFDQSLVAPVFLIFMLILVKISSTGSFLIDGATSTAIPVGTYFNFAVIVALMITAVKVTKKLSGEVGGTLTSFGVGVVGAGIGLATGGMASIARRTIGKGAMDIANNQELKDRAARGDVGARLKLAAAQRVSTSSFDIRNTKAGGLIKKTGIDINKGIGPKKGGFAETVETAEKKAEKESKFMIKGIEATPGEISTGVRRRRDELAEDRSELARLNNLTTRSVLDERKMKGLKEKIDSHKDLDDQGMEKKIKGEIEAKKKEERLTNLANREENKIVNKITGTGKEKAAKIRKAIKEKSGAEKLEDAVKQAAKEQSEKTPEENQTSKRGTGGTSGGAGGSTGNTGGTSEGSRGGGASGGTPSRGAGGGGAGGTP